MRCAPILITAFNRPDKLRTLIDSLRVVAPDTLFISVDAARPEVAGESDAVEAVISEIARIDWTDGVTVWRREQNRGLKAAVSDAVSWVLNQTGRAIVLEDDLIPTASALRFLTQGLEDFSSKPTVGHVSGYSYVPRRDISDPTREARTTRYPASWGWATWDSAWAMFRPDLASWREWLGVDGLREVLGDSRAVKYWAWNFDYCVSRGVDSWLVPWTASMWAAGQQSISPTANLIRYGGWASGTHTTGNPVYPEVPPQEGAFLGGRPLAAASLDDRADRWYEKHILGTGFATSWRRRAAIMKHELLSR